MASITIRNLDDDVKTRFPVRAVEHHRSVEEGVRVILRDAVNGGPAAPRDLARFNGASNSKWTQRVLHKPFDLHNFSRRSGMREGVAQPDPRSTIPLANAGRKR